MDAVWTGDVGGVEEVEAQRPEERERPRNVLGDDKAERVEDTLVVDPVRAAARGGLREELKAVLAVRAVLDGVQEQPELQRGLRVAEGV